MKWLLVNGKMKWQVSNDILNRNVINNEQSVLTDLLEMAIITGFTPFEIFKLIYSLKTPNIALEVSDLLTYIFNKCVLGLRRMIKSF